MAARLPPFISLCAGCGYDLRGIDSAEQCPECGLTGRADIDAAVQELWRRGPWPAVRRASFRASAVGVLIGLGLFFAEMRIEDGSAWTMGVIGGVTAMVCWLLVPVGAWWAGRTASGFVPLRAGLFARNSWWFLVPLATLPVEAAVYGMIGNATDPGVCSVVRSQAVDSVAVVWVPLRWVLGMLTVIAWERAWNRVVCIAGETRRAGLACRSPMGVALAAAIAVSTVGAVCSLAVLDLVKRKLGLHIFFLCNFF